MWPKGVSVLCVSCVGFSQLHVIPREVGEHTDLMMGAHDSKVVFGLLRVEPLYQLSNELLGKRPSHFGLLSVLFFFLSECIIYMTLVYIFLLWALEMVLQFSVASISGEMFASAQQSSFGIDMICFY